MRLTTWNLQGRERPDLDAVSDVLRAGAADVVVLQEVQRRQAAALADRLGVVAHVWRFKHWPVIVPPEGLAVLSSHPVADVRTTVLAARWSWWSHRRRIAIHARVQAPGGALDVVDVHLGAGVGDAERTQQAATVAASGADVVAGDMNARPGSTVLDTFVAVGLLDAWAAVRGDEPGLTNWRTGPRDGPPVQRLDHVFVGPQWRVTDASVPAYGDPGFECYGALSDHLPVTVDLEAR